MSYVVIFECDDPVRKAALTEALRAKGDWAELTSHSYLIECAETISDLMEALQPLIGSADNLWVLTATAPWSGYGDGSVDDFLHQELGDAEDYIPKDWDETSSRRR